nr:MAG TPA: hypothetical protein [Caudoviricetes sp.]
MAVVIPNYYFLSTISLEVTSLPTTSLRGSR